MLQNNKLSSNWDFKSDDNQLQRVFKTKRYLMKIDDIKKYILQ